MEFYGSIDSVSGSITASVFSGSFVGDGSQIYGIQASGVTGLNLSQISSGSATASIAPSGFTVNTNAKILGNLTVTGSIIAQNYIVSSSVTYMTTSYASGSSAFGDSLNDIHLFTGSVNITGSINLNGQAIGTGKLDESTFNSYTSSQEVVDADQTYRIAALETSSVNLSSFSSSINTTIDNELNTKNVISGSIQVTLSGTTGYSTFSSSISNSIATLSGSVATIDNAQNGRLNALETASSSLNTFTSSASGRLNAIENTTSSLNTFTSSINQTIDSELNAKNVISGSIQVDITGTTGYSTFSSSISSSISSSAASMSSSIGSLSSSVASTTSGLSSSIGSLSSSVATTTSGLSSSIGSLSSSVSTSIGTLSSSVATTTSGLSSSVGSLSSSVATTTSGLSSSIGSLSSSIATTDAGIKTRLNTLEGITGSYATTGSNTFKGTQNVSGSILPTVDSAFDLGDATHQFRHLYLSSASLYIDGNKVLGSTAQELQITTTSGQSIKILEDGTDTITLQSADGDISFLSSGGGDIILDPTTGLISIKGTLQVQDGNKIRSSGGNQVVFGDDVTVTGSLRLTGTIQGVDLLLLSSSISSSFANASSSLGSLSSSVATTDSNQNSRLNSLESNSGSLNSFSSSINTVIKNKMNVDNVISGSAQVTLSSTTGYSTFSSSIATTTANISSSLGTVSSSVVNQGGRLDAIETATSSLNSFTSSINTTIDTELNTKNVVSSSAQVYITGTTGYSTFSSSIATTTSGLSSSIGSLSSSVSTSIGGLSSSVATTDANQNTRLGNLEFSSASYNSFTSSINGTIKSKMNNDNVISGSIQVDLTATTNYTSFSSSIATTTNTLSSSIATTTSGLSSSIGSLSSSVATTTSNLSSSIATTTSGLSSSIGSLSSSIATTDATQNGRLGSLEGVSGSYATTGSNRFNGDQIVTGSVTITQNLTVLGSSSIVYTTASQLEVTSNVIYLNAYSPAQRFAGISVYDSGSLGETGSLFWDSLNGGWVYQKNNGASYHGGGLMSGPRNTGSLGQETYPTKDRILKGLGGDHLGDSIIFEYTGSQTIGISGSLIVTGSILSTGTSLVSGSSQIDITATANYTTFSSSISSSISSSVAALSSSVSTSIGSLSSSVATTTSGLSSSVATTTANLSSSIGSVSSSLSASINSLSGSISTSIGSLSSSVATTTSGLSSSIGSLSSSVATTTSGLSSSIGSLSSSVATTTLNLSSSISTSIGSLSSSIATTDANQNTRLGLLETSTGSLNTFTSSINTTIDNELNNKGVISGSIQVSITGTTGYSTFSSSINSSISSSVNLLSGSVATTDANTSSSIGLLSSSIATTTSGLSSSIGSLSSSVATTTSGLSSSIGSISSSLSASINSLSASVSTTDAAQNTRLGLLETSTGSLNTFTSSINTTIKNKMNSDGVISSSAQVVSALPSGTVSGSSQVLSGTGIWSGSAQLPSGVVSGSSQIIAGLPSGTVSGSSQITFGSISGLPTLVSGSSQISYTGITNVPTGIVSGSSQISLTGTTGFGSYINQALLTTSSPTFAGLTSTGNIQTSGTGVYIKAGLYTWIGGSGGDYGSIGYNIGYTTTSNSYTYAVNDYSSMLRFHLGGFQFKTAPSGTSGAITYTDVLTLSNSGIATFVSADNSGNRTTQNDILILTQTNNSVPYSGFGSGILFRGTTYNSGGSGVPGIRNWGRIATQLTDSSFGTTGENMYFQVAAADNSDTLTTVLTLKYDTTATFVSSVTATSFIGGGSGLTSLPSTTSYYPTLNQNTTGTASNITAYTINQSVGTGNTPTFVALTLSQASTSSFVANISATPEAYVINTSSTRSAYNNAGTLQVWTANPNSVNSAYLVDINAYNSSNGATNVFFGAVAGGTGNGAANFVIGRRTGTQTWAESFRIDTSGNSNVYGTLVTTNQITAQYANARISTYDGTNNFLWGLWDGSNSRIESSSRPIFMTTYSGNITFGFSGAGYYSMSTTAFYPNTSASYTLGTSSNRWSTIYTNDLSLKNDYGDYTIVEGEENLYLYNNKSGKVFTFNLTEVDPSTAPPKKYLD